MAKQRFQDGHGVYFDEVWWLMSVMECVKIRRVTDPEIREHYRGFGRCPLCRNLMKMEPHHLTGGSKGRSDEHCNLIGICGDCHDRIQSQPSEYKRVWKAKWKTDRGHTDWLRLCLLLGRVPFDTLD